MRKVIYPKGTQYVQDYLNIFQNEIGRMQQALDTLRNTYAAELGHIYQDVNDILKAEYDILKKKNEFSGFMLYSYSSLEKEDAAEEIKNLCNELKSD